MDNLDREDADVRHDDADADALIAQAEADDDIGTDPEGLAPGAIYSRDAFGRFSGGGREEKASGEGEGTDEGGEGEEADGKPKASSDTFRQMREFLDETEGRRRAEREAAELRREVDRMRQAAEPKADPAEDLELMFRDPAEYQRRVRESMQEALAEQRFEMQEFMARQQHGDALAEAQKALRDSGNEALANAFLRERNPFDAMVAWHKREKTLAAIPDGDMTKFEASVQERLLKDPAFLARAVEAARGQAQAGLPAPGKTRGNLTRLPSVARAGSAASAALPDEPSDQELLDELTGAA